MHVIVHSLEDLPAATEECPFVWLLDNSPPQDMGRRACRDSGDDEVATKRERKKEKKNLNEALHCSKEEAMWGGDVGASSGLAPPSLRLTRYHDPTGDSRTVTEPTTGSIPTRVAKSNPTCSTCPTYLSLGGLLIYPFISTTHFNPIHFNPLRITLIYFHKKKIRSICNPSWLIRNLTNIILKTFFF